MTKKFNIKSIISLTAFFALFCMLLSGCGKKPPKVYRVGILSGAESFVNIVDGFKAKMSELGYIEGKNIVYDIHKSNVDPAQEQQVAKKFVADKVDLIFAFPTEAAFAAKSATCKTAIPVVFAMAGIEGNNLVESVRQPGGNITGVRFPNKESTAKRLEFLHELVPNAKRIYLIYDPTFPNAPFAMEALHAAAAPLGITFVEDFVKNIEEYKLALKKRAAMKHIGVDAVFLMPDFMNASPEGLAVIVKFANEYNLPVGGGMDISADGGAMFSFVPSNFEQGRLAADLADKIFKGTSAGTIPVVTPELRLRLNYKVIRKLGLDVPDGLLNRADEIIR
ncbi:MAG: ABC transporter substrate-binding protein [Phycisphaerae bacterium]